MRMVPTSSAQALRAYSPRTAVINAYRHASYHSQQCIRPVFAPARLDLSVRAGNGESEALPQTMTAEEAYKVLDLTQSSSFEDVVQAKNRKLAAADGDMEKVRFELMQITHHCCTSCTHRLHQHSANLMMGAYTYSNSRTIATACPAGYASGSSL